MACRFVGSVDWFKFLGRKKTKRAYVRKKKTRLASVTPLRKDA